MMSAQMSISHYLSREEYDSNKVDKEFQLELMQQLERLQQFEFLASHNLRGPVATILGLSQLLDISLDDPRQHKQIVGYLKQTALQLDDIVKDLQEMLDQQHRHHLVKEEIPIQKIVQKVSKDLEEAIAGTNTGILCDFGKASTLYGTSTSLYNVFYQLISNAIKFRNTELSPMIMIEAFEKDGFTHVIITDNGLGIDLFQHGHKLFSPYSRFHTHAEGKGLGLHVARTLLRQMGGGIQIESTPLEGTICSFHIPSPPLN